MFFGILTLVTALAISAVAIYYSVAGLAAIFAAAVIPIIIMGTILETSKLVTIVWLHRYWHQASWWLKTYLTTAVIVLMFITSMGIFGWLSNAHVQQTALGDNTVAQLERIESEIARQEAIISRAEDKIETATTEGVGADSNIQSQIDREQARIDRAYERAEPAIQEQRRIMERQEGRILEQIEAVDSDIERLDTALAQGEVALAQSIIGVESDGILGPNTRQAIQDFRDRKAEEKAVLEQRLAAVGNDPRVQAARQEIERIRNRVEQEVAQSNELINRLRAQLGTSTGEDIDAVIDEQNTRITEASQEIDSLTQEKFEIESKVRQLEAEVGPIKYIAEFVYGEDADKNLLEEAVRWVIVIIIFVFDPLAVLLLIASQYTFRWHGRELFGGDGDNPPEPTPPPKPIESAPAANEEFGLTVEEAAEPYIEGDPHDAYNDDRLATAYDLENPVAAEKKDTESWEELKEKTRQAVLDEQDNSVHWHDAKKLWKQDHPDLTIKDQKQKFLNGEIDSLPWEDYLSNEQEAVQKKRNYITKKNNQQVRKKTQ
jgi:phosphopantetheine adenylyltransferase